MTRKKKENYQALHLCVLDSGLAALLRMTRGHELSLQGSLKPTVVILMHYLQFF